MQIFPLIDSYAGHIDEVNTWLLGQIISSDAPQLTLANGAVNMTMSVNSPSATTTFSNSDGSAFNFSQDIAVTGGISGTGDITRTGEMTLTTNPDVSTWGTIDNECRGITAGISTTSSLLGFHKSNGTLSSQSVCSSGDLLGRIIARGWRTGTTYGGASAIYFKADALHTSTSTPGRIEFWTTPDTSVTLLQRGTIDSSGRFAIGSHSPTAFLHLLAGTIVAGTAPLKFTSGPLLTTAEAGGFEFLTDDFYGTITTGAARKKFVLDNGTDLVSGRVPYAFTNGRLIDSANFTFNGTSLLTINDNSANTSGIGLAISQAGSGDALASFSVAAKTWNIGIDNSNDNFAFSTGTHLGNLVMLSIDTLANMELNGGGFTGGGKFTTSSKVSSDTVVDVFAANLERGGAAGGIGLGLGYNFGLENSAGAIHDAGRFEYIWEDPTTTQEDSQFNLKVMSAGSFVTLLNLSGLNSLATITGGLKVTTGFGCNSKTAQTAYASGGAAATTAGIFGFGADAERIALTTLVANIRLALIANGILS